MRVKRVTTALRLYYRDLIYSPMTDCFGASLQSRLHYKHNMLRTVILTTLNKKSTGICGHFASVLRFLLHALYLHFEQALDHYRRRYYQR